jgi:lysophospholipase L1-like esterase
VKVRRDLMQNTKKCAKNGEKSKLVYLPEKYDLVVGDTFELFYKGILLCKNPYAYNILVTCQIGKAYGRKFEVTATESGTYPLAVTVSDDFGNVIDKAQTSLVVKDKMTSPEKLVNVLCIGDSLTEGDYGSGTAGKANKQILNYPYYLAKTLCCQTINYGLCGKNAQNYYTDYYSLADISDCDVILVMLGTNRGLDGDYGKYYNKLIEAVKKDMKEGAIIVLITPQSATTDSSKVTYGYSVNVASAYAFVTNYANENDIAMIDAYMYSPIQPDMETFYQPNDGLHMAREGYKAFAEFIADELVNILEEN